MSLLDTAGWVVFFGVGPLLWAAGVSLFLRSSLSRPRKMAWAGLLVALGAAIGFFLPLQGIRNRYLLLLAVLPVLAGIDIGLARSDRGYSFWLRACAFEIGTVFGSAAVTRLGMTFLRGAP